MQTVKVAGGVLVILLLASCPYQAVFDPVAAEGLASASILYIHGAGDSPAVWANDLVLAYGGYALDWTTDAADRMAAPARGYDIGLAIAELMDDVPRTILAHSAGAWVAQGIADGLAARAVVNAPSIVFLDPFTALSLVQPFAGARMLGLDTLSVETWYTTHDPIPFTAGAVAWGEATNVDEFLPDTGTEAHWDVIDWWVDNHH